MARLLRALLAAAAFTGLAANAQNAPRSGPPPAAPPADANPPVKVLEREQTLDQDLAGPRVEWDGEIVGSVTDRDDTCFVLSRLRDGYDYGRQDDRARFIACNPGPFDPSRFGPGRVLRVLGNLGPAMPRLIGGKVYHYPLVAGAALDLTSIPADPYLYGPPYYGPAYGFGYYSRPFGSWYGGPYGYSPFWYDPFWGPGPYRRWR